MAISLSFLSFTQLVAFHKSSRKLHLGSRKYELVNEKLILVLLRN